MFEVSVHKLDGDDKVIGLASVTVDDQFVLKSMKLIKSDKAEGGFFVGMPTYKTSKTDAEGNSIYKEYYKPATKEFAQQLKDAVLKSYETGESVRFREDQKEEFSTFVEKTNYKDSSTVANVNIYIKPAGAKAEEGKTVSDFVIDSYRINRAGDSAKNPGQLFVAAPSYKAKETDENGKAVYKDICFPTTKEFTKELYGGILEKFENLTNDKQSDKEASGNFTKGVDVEQKPKKL